MLDDLLHQQDDQSINGLQQAYILLNLYRLRNSK